MLKRRSDRAHRTVLRLLSTVRDEMMLCVVDGSGLLKVMHGIGTL